MLLKPSKTYLGLQKVKSFSFFFIRILHRVLCHMELDTNRLFVRKTITNLDIYFLSIPRI